MINRSILISSLAVGLFFTLLFNACNPKSAKTDGNTDTTQTSGPVLPSIVLDSLSITGAAFMAKLDETKKQNIIFNYFFDTTTVTLHGWVLIKGKSAQNDTGSFSPTYDFKLIPKGKTKIIIGPTTYLSNQVILGKTVKQILGAIKGKNATLFFSPMKDATGRISYTIRIQIIDKENIIFLPVTYKTNPSPPHQAFD